MSIVRGLGFLANRAGNLKNQLFSSKNLFYTNVAISISLSAVGDILEQHYEILQVIKHDDLLLDNYVLMGKNVRVGLVVRIQGDWDEWSMTRTGHMAVSGMSVGMVCHHWYRFLDRRMPGRTLGVVLKKVLVDQVICSPICIGVFFVTLGILERNTWSEFKQEIKDKGRRLYIAEWIIWPPAQIINFGFLPTRFRVLYDNTISLGYDVYTSQVKHDKPNASKKLQ